MKKIVNEQQAKKRKLVKEAASLELALESSWVKEKQKIQYKARLHSVYDEIQKLRNK
jgi:hypothetical protein